MRVIVCGGRDFTNRDLLFDALDAVNLEKKIELVIEGGQRTYEGKGREKKIVGGADYFGMEWAKARGVAFETMSADWDQYGRKAGPMRNLAMLMRFEPNLVIALPGGAGTQNMIQTAIDYGFEVRKIS